MARLRQILVLTRDVPRAVHFWHGAAGLPLVRCTDRYAEFSLDGDGGEGRLAVKLAAGGEASMSTGYSPVVSLDVRGLDEVVAAMVQQGAVLDGPVKHTVHGKAALLRSMDGHMVGLYEEAVK